MDPVDSPERLGRHRLNAHYLSYRQHGFFAADGLLNRLGADAWKVAREEKGQAKQIASALATVFCDAANRMEGRPIANDAGERWFGIMDGPIVRCLDILTGKVDDPAAPAIADLHGSYAIVSAEISN